MKDLQPALAEVASITGITDVDTSLTDQFTQRMRLTFANGWALSIVRGLGTYGSDVGLFEIAPITPDNELVDAEVEGWLTVDDVVDRCRAIAGRTAP